MSDRAAAIAVARFQVEAENYAALIDTADEASRRLVGDVDVRWQYELDIHPFVSEFGRSTPSLWQADVTLRIGS